MKRTDELLNQDDAAQSSACAVKHWPLGDLTIAAHDTCASRDRSDIERAMSNCTSVSAR